MDATVFGFSTALCQAANPDANQPEVIVTKVFVARRLGGIVFAAGILVTTQVGAWEADVHYGLTYWLAERAGWPPKDAQAIARANWNLDQDPFFDAVQVMVWEIMFSLSPPNEPSERVRKAHFPSRNPPGMAPAQRLVHRDSAPGANPSDLKDLDELGRFLHAHQDSWSHEGQPDVPLGSWLEFRPDWAWSHPESRGAWNTHKADITCAWPGAAIEMAKKTYERLCHWKRSRTGKICVAFDKHVVKLEHLLSMPTQQEKISWFQENGLSDKTIAAAIRKDTNLPRSVDANHVCVKAKSAVRQGNSDGRQSRSVAAVSGSTFQVVAVNQPIVWRLASVSSATEPIAPTPNACRAVEPIAQKMLDRWVSNPEDFAKDDGKTSPRYTPSGTNPPVDWAVFWLMWLFSDHGVIEALGHGKPDSTGLGELKTLLREAARYRSDDRLGTPPVRLLSNDLNMSHARIRGRDRTRPKSSDIAAEYRPQFQIFDATNANSRASMNTRCAVAFRVWHSIDDHEDPRTSSDLFDSPYRLLRDVPLVIFEDHQNEWVIRELGWVAM